MLETIRRIPVGCLALMALAGAGALAVGLASLLAFGHSQIRTYWEIIALVGGISALIVPGLRLVQDHLDAKRAFAIHIANLAHDAQIKAAQELAWARVLMEQPQPSNQESSGSKRVVYLTDQRRRA